MHAFHHSGSTSNSYNQTVAHSGHATTSGTKTPLEELKLAAMALTDMMAEIEDSDHIGRIEFALTNFSSAIDNPSVSANASGYSHQGGTADD